MNISFYHIDYDGDVIADGFTSISDARKATDKWWEDKNDWTSDMRVGEVRTTAVWIVGTDEDGEEVTRNEYEVTVTGQPNDDEHRTHGRS
jgi:hypothetical protein